MRGSTATGPRTPRPDRLQSDYSLTYVILGPVNAIEVHGLRKSYGSLEAVGGVSFEVASGEVFCLLGPNGAGKTTITEILEGYRSRNAGSGRCSAWIPQAGHERSVNASASCSRPAVCSST